MKDGPFDGDISDASNRRNANLDLLRAAAIVAVVFFHVCQMSPVPLTRLMNVASFGQYGVDLFFVLSGWLIGGLYWKEYNKFGNIDIGRFWLRRWLRTIPPYLIALLLSWLAVWMSREEPFDLGYLIFIQNYYDNIPFFLVSWSLCIEEHFYLFVPLISIPFLGRGKFLSIFFISLLLIPLVCRIVYYITHVEGRVPVFGFELTATHLRMEGLLLGFWLSRLAIAHPAVWLRDSPVALWGSIAIGIGFIFAVIAGSWLVYCLGFSALAWTLALLLFFLQGRKPGRLATSRIVYLIALASYSVYLTHALMIHVARIIVQKIPNEFWPVYFPLAIVLIVFSGGAFYWMVERASIRLRDRWVPRRSKGFCVKGQFSARAHQHCP